MKRSCKVTNRDSNRETKRQAMWHGANYSTRDYKVFCRIQGHIKRAHDWKKKPIEPIFLINDVIGMVHCMFTSLSFTFIVVSSTEELSLLFKTAHSERRLLAKLFLAGSTLIWHLQILTALNYISPQTLFNM